MQLNSDFFLIGLFELSLFLNFILFFSKIKLNDLNFFCKANYFQNIKFRQFFLKILIKKIQSK
jgi:hypothetical protein